MEPPGKLSALIAVCPTPLPTQPPCLPGAFPMDIQPLHPRFAAEVTGLDLAGPLDAATLDMLHDAFIEHAVLLFAAST